jgi:hypothetical protein
LHSQMNGLDYLTEPAHNCAEDDVNARAFELAIRTIGGRDAVEEYLACGAGVWPLGATWDLGEVETAEAPLSKVTVPLPKVSAMKGSKNSDRDFVARIATAANKLVGCYGATEHRICLGQIPKGRLNCVFEVDGRKEEEANCPGWREDL